MVLFAPSDAMSDTVSGSGNLCKLGILWLYYNPPTDNMLNKCPHHINDPSKYTKG